MKFSIALASGLLVVLNTVSGVFAAPDATNETAAVPLATYRSPFHDYRGLGEDKLIPWKQANDEVGRIGGWRVYAREANAVTPPTASPETAAPVTAPASTPAEAPARREPVRTGHDHHRQE
ncbi:MAG: hypothetical protein ABI790_13785 [Betaproteobacteria bacterium]